MIKDNLTLNTVEISPNRVHCVVFDMDGVVTKTATVHASAWKELFDDFLKKKSDQNGTPFVPFNQDEDYNLYVDGKPRNEGIQSFLLSRGIDLPLGTAKDSVECETIYGLGNKKNQYFLDYVKNHGVEPYDSTVSLIHELKRNGIKVAIISSSKNCSHILESAGVLDLFEARIDGEYAERHGIKGKPEPDVFLEAARQVGVDPKSCVIVEDAISGVQAGNKGGFAFVIGVDRVGQEEELYKNGADVVVKDLAEVTVLSESTRKDAIDEIDEIKLAMHEKQPVFFIDFDGTLSPIAPTPDSAILPEETKKTLELLAQKFIVAIISGRDLAGVKGRVGIENLYYAGSHGYDISGPQNKSFQISEAEKFIKSINLAEAELRDSLKSMKGIIIERKKFGIAIHYRLVKEEDIDAVNSAVESVHRRHLDLRRTYGKKVFELQPKIDWNKGKALQWLLKCLNLDQDHVLAFYLGDDLTDEDAFKVVNQKGIAIAVQEEPKFTFANYTLKDPEHVKIFLQKIMELPSKNETSCKPVK